MNLRNKVSFFLLSFVAVPLFAQTPQQELERLQQNYIQSFISNDDRMASLVELLSGIQPEMEISDQVVVELHQRYPFNVEKIAGYMETIREDGSWPDINYNDQKRSGWSVKEHADRVLGQMAKVTETVDNDNSMGAVYVDGKTWSARSSDGSVIPAGTRVQVERMEGVKLFVSTCEKKEETTV